MAFAQADEVATRFGGDLSDADLGRVEQDLEAATAAITAAVSKDDDWADSLDPVPRILRFVCVEVACRLFSNPSGVSSEQEQLGQYSHSQRFREGDRGGGLLLTPGETLLVRRVVWGRTTGSSRVESLADDLYDHGCS